jgi:hypothetical protein
VAQYRVLVGLNYPPDRRAEPGAVVDDLPGKSIKWLTDQGMIEAVSSAPKSPAKKESPATPARTVDSGGEE